MAAGCHAAFLHGEGLPGSGCGALNSLERGNNGEDLKNQIIKWGGVGEAGCHGLGASPPCLLALGHGVAEKALCWFKL